MKHYTLIIFAFFISSTSVQLNRQSDAINSSKKIYFPPKYNSNWEKVAISTLNWNENALPALLQFLEEKNTKSFIILHKGKIVIEEYFNNHTASSFWYWASAGKTLTSTLSGIAQDEGIISINNSVSEYLEEGWTNLTKEKESLITCKHLLSMNSGLDDRFGNAVNAKNLNYKTDAGVRWAYHNVYVKMQDVIATASQQRFVKYFNTRLKHRIGMTGLWRRSKHFNVYWSNSRSMARFGLLIAAKGKWESEQIVSEKFINQATNSSQNLNEAYGYLWWLNGKTSYMLPNTQVTFTGKLIPNAPNDLFCALGKNDQKIYIIPSKDLVIIRMGKSAEKTNFASSNFDNNLWKRINDLIN